MKPKLGTAAWLITWEAIGDHVTIPKRIAAIVNYRAGDNRIRDIVQILWMNFEYTPAEFLAWAKSNRRHPCEVRIGGGKIWCGHNPFVVARKVDSLRVAELPDGGERVLWTELPGWQFDQKSKRRIKVGAPMDCS
jgi:hypothetical protein